MADKQDFAWMIRQVKLYGNRVAQVGWPRGKYLYYEKYKNKELLIISFLEDGKRYTGIWINEPEDIFAEYKIVKR